MSEHPIELSNRIIDTGAGDAPNRVTNELSELAEGVALVESFSHSVAGAPVIQICPMWEMSKTPQPSRTARCSGRMPAYWIGISQPAKGANFAPNRA